MSDDAPKPKRKACKPTRTPAKPPKELRRKASRTAFGQPEGNTRLTATFRIGEDGLPVRNFGGKPVGTRDITGFLEKLSQYSIEELHEILEHKQEGGRSLAVGTLAWVKMYLDTLEADSTKSRVQALNLINNRLYGMPTAKVANADGSNINPLSLLLTEQSRLRPASE